MSDVNKEIGLYPMSGDVVRFVSTAKLPIGGFETELHPIQDLHGQDAPYPAGGKVNKWNPVDGTVNGYTYTIQDDGTIKIQGTGVNNAWTYVGSTKIPLADLGLAVGDAITVFASPYGAVEYYDADNPSRIGYSVSQGTYVQSTIPPNTAYVRFLEYAATTASLNGVTLDVTAKYLVAKGTVSEWSPYSNICPIYGKDSATIYVSPTPDITDETKVYPIEFPVQGFNQWDEEWELGTINDSTGQNAPETTIIRGKNYIPVIANTSYYFKTSNVTMRVFKYGADKSYLGYEWIQNNVLTLGEGVCFIRFRMYVAYGTTYNHDISINYPSTETGYYPYKGRTVYAGTLTINEDGSGQIVSTMASVDLSTGGFTYNSGWGVWNKTISDAKAVADNNTPSSALCSIAKSVKASGYTSAHIIGTFAQNTNGTFFIDNGDSTTLTGQLVYELAEPITLNLTVEQIETLIGFNYVWNNVGTTNITFQYYTGGEGMAITFLDCWTYPKAKLDEMFKAVDDRLDALEAAADSSNAKTTLLETKEIATGPVAEREGDE